MSPVNQRGYIGAKKENERDRQTDRQRERQRQRQRDFVVKSTAKLNRN